jgi:rhodanese-related sulfurtransferase
VRMIARTGAKRLATAGVLLAALLLTACGGGEADSPDGAGTEDAPGSDASVGERIRTPGGSFTRVSPEELRSTMREDELVLVNTHVPFEGDIPGTDLSIPYDEIGRNLQLLPGKDEKIALYCRSGTMSASAAETLVRLGYDNVWDLAGGMIAWREAGYRLEGA